MTQEEKAKRYDEAIEKGKQIQNTPYTAHWDIMKEVAEHLLPELKESEDVKIKSDIQFAVRCAYGDKSEQTNKILAWLESQGETSPVLSNSSNIGKVEQKPAWSEEDKRCLTNAIRACEHMSDGVYDYSQSYIDAIKWLKSIRPQSHWKPSEEQMHYLSWIANVNLGDSVVEQEVSKHLNELYTDLKKLKGEEL